MGKASGITQAGEEVAGEKEKVTQEMLPTVTDFFFFPQEAFFGGNNHGSVQMKQTEVLRSKTPCWAHPVQPGVMAGTHHPAPISACCKLTQKPRSQENSQPHPPQHILVFDSP